MLDVAKIEREILAGHSNERKRLDCARKSLDFYNRNFERYPVREPGQNSDGNRYPRYSSFMRRVVDVLSGLLYKEGPTRSLPDHPEASEWLEHVYRSNNANAVLQKADALTFVADAALVEVQPSEDPDCPVKLQLWDASSFMVWESETDPTAFDAVAVIDRFDGRRRCRLWTADEVREYQTETYNELTKTSGATAFRRVSARPNTLGVIPFVPVHFELPTTQFWTPGPGEHLAAANDAINKRLTDLQDSCRFNLNPILFLSNFDAGYRPPSPLKPGDVINPPPSGDIAGNGTATPDAKYLQADPSFVDAAWADCQSHIDHVLEMEGVPPVAIRMAESSVSSGAALIAEQIPLVNAAKHRQRKASVEEDRLAKVVLTVGAAHLGSQQVEEYTVTSAALAAAAESPGLVLRWPALWPKIPGTEADQSDQWLLDNGLVSRTQLVMERHSLTEEEAEAYLEQVAKHLKRERELMAEAMPPPPETPDDEQADDDETLEANTEDEDEGADDGEE